MEHTLLAPHPVAPVDLMEALNWRYATKRFDVERKVSQDDINVLLEVLRLAPSSIGLQPWKFILVEDTEKRKELYKLSLDQSQITDASHLLLLCARNNMDEAYIDKLITYEQKALGYEATMLQAFRPHAVAYIKTMSEHQLKEWMSEQVYIALGFLLSACAMLRIDACPIEAFDRHQTDKLLDLPKLGISSRTLVAIGYRSMQDHHALDKKVRFRKEDIFVSM
jgi:nitroreductase